LRKPNVGRLAGASRNIDSRIYEYTTALECGFWQTELPDGSAAPARW